MEPTMGILSKKEERAWEYILRNRTAEAADIATACEVSLKFAQQCLDRIGTPREVFEAELVQRNEVKSTRVQTLETAIKLTAGDRNKAYGPPHGNLSDCALLWDAYLAIRKGAQIDAEAVAWMNVLQKIARSVQPGYHPDNYTDAAAYSAIAGECREIEIKGEKE
jgi:hypothetical protein